MSDPPDPKTCTLSNDELKMLARLDERSARVDSKLDSIVEQIDATNSRVEENSEKISANRRRTLRNTTVLGGYSAGLLALMMWAADKVARFV